MADFMQTLMEMRGGRAAADCSLKLGKLIEGVKETGKKGELILKVSIEPSRVGMDGVKEVELRHSCTAKIPEPDHGKTLFFIAGTNLMRDDPAQMAFELETNGNDNADDSRTREGADSPRRSAE